MMRHILIATAILTLVQISLVDARDPTSSKATDVSSKELKKFRARMTSAVTKHLDLLLADDGKVPALASKGADALTAISFYLMYEINDDPRYRAAGVELADRIVSKMHETPLGVLYIKEKEKPTGEVIPGGGPPSFGWYTAYAAYIYHKEGGHDEDVKYIARVLDDFPWNDEGWWSADIDINTGVSKQPLTKPSPINKNAAMAMSAAMLSTFVADLDPKLSKRLKAKADRAVYEQIFKVQEPDGFWHYNLNGNDPNGKDILGYFMITLHALSQMQEFTDGYRDDAFQAAVDKGNEYALKHIAPMTDPNEETGTSPHTTRSTPDHFTLQSDIRRGIDLALILVESGQLAEGIKIADHWMTEFSHGDEGKEGSHAVHPVVLMLYATRTK